MSELESFETEKTESLPIHGQVFIFSVMSKLTDKQTFVYPLMLTKGFYVGISQSIPGHFFTREF